MFELDRAPSGRIKVSFISTANLVALLGLIGVALGSWNSMTNQVAIMNARQDQLQREVVQFRTDLQTSLIARDGDQRELRGKVEIMSNRLVAVETVLQRLERKLDPPAK